MGDWLLFKAAILGLVEGATEFIPVSSTGHLIIAREWLNWTDAVADVFIIFIQLPAILAVITTLGTREESRRLAYNLVIGTLPAVVIGLPTDDWVEANLYTVATVAIALIVGGLAILWIERWNHTTRVHALDDIPIRLALYVGLFQVLALLFPGISRSGATIMGGLVVGLSRIVATEFSFFLAIPAMFGATALKLWDARDFITLAEAPLFLVGAITSFLSALYVIRTLINFVSSHTFIPFAWYRIAIGVLLLGMYWRSIAL